MSLKPGDILYDTVPKKLFCLILTVKSCRCDIYYFSDGGTANLTIKVLQEYIDCGEFKVNEV